MVFKIFEFELKQSWFHCEVWPSLIPQEVSYVVNSYTASINHAVLQWKIQRETKVVEVGLKS